MRVATQKRIALGVTLVSIALMVYMVTVESEPGALPLALIVGGLIWYFVARARAHRG